MGDWPIIYPKRKLNPAFRKAVQLSMANAHKAKWQLLRGEVPTVHGLSGTVLSTVADFTHQSELSRVLNVPTVGASPRTIARLTKLAQAVDFGGDLFEDQEPIIEHEAPAHGVRL